MRSRYNLPRNIRKSIQKLILQGYRKWLTIALASIFVMFSFFPIPLPQIFKSESLRRIEIPSIIEEANAQTVPALCAVPGKDGVGAPAGIINTYYPGVSTVTAGATLIAVGTKDINGATTDIVAGDLLLIIQTQDAAIDSTNTDAYGDGVGGDVPALAVGGTQPTNGASGYLSGSAGNYEYVVATGAVSGGFVPIKGTNGGGLINSYVSAAATATQGKQTYQVVRVPQYSSATLGAATSSYWNGSTGGIVAYDVAGNLSLTGGINVNSKGFRGGGGRLLGGATSPNTDYRTSTTIDKNGSKAEGIAGTPRFVINPTTLALVDNVTEGYPNGSYGRGAPGNAGGGSTDGNSTGNDQNSGGGGGSNGGSGGIGGRSWSSNLPTGGFGGKPFSATTSRLILGGGGGAGTTNNGSFSPPNTDTSGSGLYSSGASGGGMVMLRTNTVSGTGAISANGSNARDVTRDGAGGGGAGGSVLVSALSNNLAGLTINVVGGNGGSALFSASHGPGGGGGGGVVVSSAGVTTNLQGGIAGVTGITSNPNNGAIAGTGLALPIAVGPIPGASSGAACVPALAVVKTTSTPTVNRGGQATYKIVVSNGAGLATANNVAITDNSLPTGFTLAASPAPTISLIGGSTRPTTSNPTAGTSNLSWGTFSIPGGGSVEIQFTVDVGTGVATGTYNNPASATYSDPATSGSKTVNYNTANTGEDVTVVIPSSPKLLLVKRITNVTRGGVSISPSGSDNFNIFNDDLSTTVDNDPNWSTPNTYLKGGRNGGSVAPGDRLEYTIYFLSAGSTDITNVTICDLVPANTTFVNNTYNGQTPIDTGSSGGNLGIALASNSAVLPTNPTVYTSSAIDGDRGSFYPAGIIPTPNPCSRETTPGSGTYVPISTTDNVNGLVTFNIVKSPTIIPKATSAGTPADSYGFVRFAVTVN